MSLFLCNTSHHKPDVHEACRHETIVTAHHAEPFLERCTVVGCCHAAIEKVDYHTSHIAHGQTAVGSKCLFFYSGLWLKNPMNSSKSSIMRSILGLLRFTIRAIKFTISSAIMEDTFSTYLSLFGLSLNHL